MIERISSLVCFFYVNMEVRPVSYKISFFSILAALSFSKEGKSYQNALCLLSPQIAPYLLFE
jgi:hypothetical protein